jgi:cytochrome c peroxidase
MHDGRFQTLEEVVDFYDLGVVDHPNLSNGLRVDREPDGAPLCLNLTDEEKAALVAFLKTLTDAVFTADPKWSDPFNYGNNEP